jgi:multimeric flavodoxin WrbA
MKAAIINGSPKRQGGASEMIVTALQSRLTQAADCAICHAAEQNRDEIMGAFVDRNALIFVFPLYVDGIPSHLLRLLDETHNFLADAAPGAAVYCIVNNGFYEARQNSVALELMKNFCVRSGLKWGQGLGVGAGGMIHAARIGRGPLKNLGKALDALAENILNRKSADDHFVEPNFPKFLYKMIAHIGWRMQAKKYGLKTKQLYDRP